MHKNINGDPALVAIERALNELRCGRAIYCSRTDTGESQPDGLLLASAETASAALMRRLEELAGTHGLGLAITRQRAEALALRPVGFPSGDEQGAILLRLRAPVAHATISLLAGIKAAGVRANGAFTVERCDALTTSALNLAKQARLLPAMLMIPSPPRADDALEISAAQLAQLTRPGVSYLERVSEARVPLTAHEDCRLVLFRDGRDASEHVAVIIGSPDVTAVPVRLHSACLTGDLLGSLRCDCGDQLRTAVDQLAAVGGGVLLYLAQEGRGIGLANKLRAYELQEDGLDTLEADQHLGFTADERTYEVAASMLRQLSLTRIQLLTNNLDKIEALQSAGIEVVSDQRLMGAVNRHNVRYIRAKRDRAGHLMPEIKMEELL